MPTDIKGLFAMLEVARTRYVLVGGLALVLHGIDRLTADVDLAVDLAPEELLRLVALLEHSGTAIATCVCSAYWDSRSYGRMPSGSTLPADRRISRISSDFAKSSLRGTRESNR